MTQAHDRAVLEPGRDLQAVRQGLALGDQAVIAGGRQRVGQAGEDAGSLVEHRRGLAVHQFLGPDHLAAIDLGDGLMAEANPQGGDGWAQFPQDFEADAGLIRIARPR